jgi:hypothetical protein
LRGRAGILSGFFDRDAATYIAAVEFEDGQALEDAIKIAINAYVIGLKTDGIWNSVLASCIMMGARTIEGALVPLKGSDPTSVNFVSGDYNRETGIKGASTKYIDSNFNDANTYVTNIHMGFYQTENASGGTTYTPMGARNSGGAGTSNQVVRDPSSNMTAFHRNGTQDGMGAQVAESFVATSRGNSSNFIYRNNTSTGTVTRAASATASGVNYWVFNRTTSGLFTPARMSFYTIGTHIDSTGLTNYRTRVKTLYDAIAAAI